MSNAVNNQLISKLGSKKLASNFYLAVTELFFQLDIDGQEFVDEFIDSYLDQASIHSKTKGQVLLETGFTRYQVKNYFSGNKKRSSNTEKNFYCHVLDKLRDVCNAAPDKTIPIKNSHKSFNSIFSSVQLSGKIITPKMLMESFIKRGFIEKVDDYNIQFITSVQTGFDNNKEKVIQVFCDTIERLSGTLIHNMNSKDDSTKRNQMSYTSIHVKEAHFETINQEVKNILRKALLDCQEIIDSYEETEDFAKLQVEKEGQEIGVSTFFYINKSK